MLSPTQVLIRVGTEITVQISSFVQIGDRVLPLLRQFTSGVTELRERNFDEFRFRCYETPEWVVKLIEIVLTLYSTVSNLYAEKQTFISSNVPGPTVKKFTPISKESLIPCADTVARVRLLNYSFIEIPK